MNDKLKAIAPAVGSGIISTEKAHRTVVLELAHLKVAFYQAHASGPRFVQGQNVMADLAEAEVFLTKAGFHLARAHQRSAVLADELGIEPTLWGDEFDTPPPQQGALPAGSGLVTAAS